MVDHARIRIGTNADSQVAAERATLICRGTKASADGDNAPARKATRATAVIDDFGMVEYLLSLALRCGAAGSLASSDGTKQ